jgi:hypothetical protein
MSALPRRLRPRGPRASATIATALGLLLLAPGSAVAADEFPRGYEGYHTY